MRISVVIPCFRAGSFLMDAVSSVLDQAGEFEIVDVLVVDDGSDDPDTQAAYEALRRLDRVRVIENTRGKGPGGARNCGIIASNGDWIALLDADDWWAKDSLAVRVEAIRRWPNADFVAGDFLQHGGGCRSSKGYIQARLENFPFLRDAYVGDPHPVFLPKPFKNFVRQPPLNTIVTMIRRSVLFDVGLYQESLRLQQDYHLFMRIAHGFDFVFTPFVVAHNRRHAQNSTGSLVVTQEWRCRAIEHLLTLPELQSLADRSALKSVLHGLHLNNSYEYRRQRQFGKAFRAACRGLWIAPEDLRLWKSLAASALSRA